MFSIYEIKAEPVGPRYKELLRWSAGLADHFLLVCRKDESLEPTGLRLLDRLEFSKVSEIESRRWPGTRVAGVLREYAVTDFSTRELERACSSLYAWRSPDLPEDLCFLANGLPVLLTASHEAEACVQASEAEVAELIAAHSA